MALPVDELRNLLVEKGGLTSEEVAQMSTKEVRQRWKDVESAVQVLDNVTLEEPKNQSLSESRASPIITDPEWTEFVLSQFTKDELDNGNPKVDGLRRVAELLLGPFHTDTTVIQAPGIDGRATVLVNLEFLTPPYRRVSGVADVSSINTVRDFATHAAATAETRAEGRALRKALKLTKVFAAEELTAPEKDADDRIMSDMVNSLKLMCSRQGIDLERLVRHNFQNKVSNSESLTQTQARELSNLLYNYSQKKVEIPDEIKA